jgi:hypothetical protein
MLHHSHGAGYADDNNDDEDDDNDNDDDDDDDDDDDAKPSKISAAPGSSLIRACKSSR